MLIPLLASLALALTPPATTQPDALTGDEIMARAHEAAGGEAWRDPGSLYMEGYGLFWRGGPDFVRYEPYRMWRVYASDKPDARQASGRVRIEALRDGEIVFQLAYDGERSYNQDGPVEAGTDDWASNFGFGSIRHAFDDGWTTDRLPDDLVDAQPVYTVRLNDPAGGETLFAIRQDDFAIVRVGFDTPRGWHERIYSDFYANTPGGFVQPGRLRLYYNGVKANEVYWTAFTTGETYDDALFRIGVEGE